MIQGPPTLPIESDVRGDEITPAAEISELAWFTYNDRERVSHVSQIIFDRLHKLGLLDA